MSGRKRNLQRYKAIVVRTEAECGIIEVVAENEDRARAKAQHKADNGGEVHWGRSHQGVEVRQVLELGPTDTYEIGGTLEALGPRAGSRPLADDETIACGGKYEGCFIVKK